LQASFPGKSRVAAASRFGRAACIRSKGFDNECAAVSPFSTTPLAPSPDICSNCRSICCLQKISGYRRRRCSTPSSSARLFSCTPGSLYKADMRSRRKVHTQAETPTLCSRAERTCTLSVTCSSRPRQHCPFSLLIHRGPQYTSTCSTHPPHDWFTLLLLPYGI
jgi:hypothetical protein